MTSQQANLFFIRYLISRNKWCEENGYKPAFSEETIKSCQEILDEYIRNSELPDNPNKKKEIEKAKKAFDKLEELGLIVITTLERDMLNNVFLPGAENFSDFNQGGNAPSGGKDGNSDIKSWADFMPFKIGCAPLIFFALVIILLILSTPFFWKLAEPYLPQKKQITSLHGGAFFRMKVNLVYKGNPQNFDIVATCKVSLADMPDTLREQEDVIAPTLFGRRMSDGSGLAIQIPDICDTETFKNGLIPADLLTDILPLVVAFDDADKLDSGVVYATEEDYNNPFSILDFKGAVIKKATLQEFEIFRSHGEKNSIKKINHVNEVMKSDTHLNILELRGKYPFFSEAYLLDNCFQFLNPIRLRVQEVWRLIHPQLGIVSFSMIGVMPPLKIFPLTRALLPAKAY